MCAYHTGCSVHTVASSHLVDGLVHHLEDCRPLPVGCTVEPSLILL